MAIEQCDIDKYMHLPFIVSKKRRESSSDRKATSRLTFPQIRTDYQNGGVRMKLKMIDFDAEILKLNDEALDCTNRMVNELEKISEEGVIALTALENQDEQLDRLESNLHRINDDISAVSKDISSMERCCCFEFPCTIIKQFRKKDKERRTAASSIIFKHSSSVRQKSAAFIPRLTEDVVENEIEGNLRQIDETLNSIKHLAVDMNVQLRIQEPKLDRIHELVENSDSAMGGANAKVKKLLSE